MGAGVSSGVGVTSGVGVSSGVGVGVASGVGVTVDVYKRQFVRATPESQGISSDLFTALLRELDASKDTEMHHFMALRHGKVI